MAEEASREEQLAAKRRAWKQHLEDWKASGLTQVDYCQRHDLSRHRFQYWKKKFAHPASSTSLVEIRFPSGHEPFPDHSPLRLVIGGQWQIIIERNFDPVALRQLMAVLPGL